MATQPIDYTALAKQFGATSSTPPPAKVDYAALAKQFGATSSIPAPDAPVAGAGPLGTPQPAAHPAVAMRGGEGNLETIPAANSDPGIIGAIKTGVHNFGARVANDGLAMAAPILHPQDTGNAILQRGGFPLTPDAIRATSYNPSGPDAGATAANVLGDVAFQGLLHGGSEVAAAAPARLKSFVAGPVDQPITGTNLTPAQRFASAQRLGVNLDAADATNSPLLKGVKSLNENSLLGANSYEKLGAANTAALKGSTDNFLNGMYPGDRESGGLDIQNALKSNQAGLQSKATEGFDSLPQDIPVPGLSDVGKTARGMAAENAPYQSMFPSLKPSKAMSVVGDVSGLAPQPPAPLRMSPFVDESGAPIASSTQAPPAQPQSFSTAQKLRSDLLDFRRNNPDIVAGQGDAMIGNLAGRTDEAITGASSLLTPQQLNTFRGANAAWGDMKQTYDDPSSPLYHAVRTDNPSTLYGGIGSKTPENARNLLGRLGRDSEAEAAYVPNMQRVTDENGVSKLVDVNRGPTMPPAVGALRRGTVEGALKTNADGSPNFKTFGTQWNRVPADYRAELFSPDQNRTLQDVANTSNVLKMDANPSGSGKLVQKVSEAGALGGALAHPPLAALPLLQYPVAKAMTSPSAVNWLMRPAAAPNPFVAPRIMATGAAAVAPTKPKGLYGKDDRRKATNLIPTQGNAALASLPAPMQTAMDTIGAKVVPGQPYSGGGDPAIASVGDHDPTTIEINDPAKFAQSPTQVIGHEATHLWQNNLPGATQANIPADSATNPYDISDAASLRKAGKTLATIPREKAATIVQTYIADPSKQKQLQPWINDMNTTPLSITMPTAPSATKMNMAVRPPGLPGNIPASMLLPRTQKGLYGGN